MLVASALDNIVLHRLKELKLRNLLYLFIYLFIFFFFFNILYAI